MEIINHRGLYAIQKANGEITHTDIRLRYCAEKILDGIAVDQIYDDMLADIESDPRLLECSDLSQVHEIVNVWCLGGISRPEHFIGLPPYSSGCENKGENENTNERGHDVLNVAHDRVNAWLLNR